MARCRAEAFKLAPPVLGCAALALVGCSPTPTAVVPPPPAAVPAAAPVAAATPGPQATAASPAPSPAAGFTPLPTPQQVVGAIAVGRPDPFAAPHQVGASAGAGAGSGAAAGLPQGLRLTGVIRTGATARAFVQVGERSGALCPGPRGQCPGGAADQPLLPAGWSVTAIDADHGLMALRFGNQRQVLRVSP